MNAATPWWQGPLLGFDTETTGIDAWNDRIVTVALVHAVPEARPVTDVRLIDAGVTIPEQATAVHGITTEMAAEHGADPAEVLDVTTYRIADAWRSGVPVVAFNAAYDFTILEAELARHGMPSLLEVAGGTYGPVIDPHVIDKQMHRRKGSRTLTATCAHYGVTLSATGAHDASTDALAAVRLVQRLAATYAELQAVTPEHLHQLQQGWRAEQMRSLRSYFDRVGKDHDGCDGSWPVRSDRPVEMAVAR